MKNTGAICSNLFVKLPKLDMNLGLYLNSI